MENAKAKLSDNAPESTKSEDESSPSSGFTFESDSLPIDFSDAWFGFQADILSKQIDEVMLKYDNCFVGLQETIGDENLLQEENLKLRAENLYLSILVTAKEKEIMTKSGGKIAPEFGEETESEDSSSGEKIAILDIVANTMPSGILRKAISVIPAGFLEVMNKAKNQTVSGGDSVGIDAAESNRQPQLVRLVGGETESEDSSAGEKIPILDMVAHRMTRGILPKAISVRSAVFLEVMSKNLTVAGGDSIGIGAAESNRQAQLFRLVAKPFKNGDEVEEIHVHKQGMSKTELCNKWEETGSCLYEDRCHFAHGVEELLPVLRHPRYKTEICCMITSGGTCPYGHRCHFGHSLDPNQEKELQKHDLYATALKIDPGIKSVGIGTINCVVMVKDPVESVLVGTDSRSSVKKYNHNGKEYFQPSTDFYNKIRFLQMDPPIVITLCGNLNRCECLISYLRLWSGLFGVDSFVNAARLWVRQYPACNWNGADVDYHDLKNPVIWGNIIRCYIVGVNDLKWTIELIGDYVGSSEYPDMQEGGHIFVCGSGQTFGMEMLSGLSCDNYFIAKNQTRKAILNACLNDPFCGGIVNVLHLEKHRFKQVAGGHVIQEIIVDKPLFFDFHMLYMLSPNSLETRNIVTLDTFLKFHRWTVVECNFPTYLGDISDFNMGGIEWKVFAVHLKLGCWGSFLKAHCKMFHLGTTLETGCAAGRLVFKDMQYVVIRGDNGTLKAALEILKRYTWDELVQAFP